MRVLLVAPRTDLKLVDEETQDILRSGLDVTPLVGEVTSRELLREIRAGAYDVLWLATHGEKQANVLGATKYGILLSDGYLDSSELVAQVRGKFSLVYLNTCTSFKIAQAIQEEANVTVVGTLFDSLVKKIDSLEKKISHDYAVAMQSVVLSRRLLWVSLALHVPEWIALVWLWMGTN
jgi:hypothetical protein